MYFIKIVYLSTIKYYISVYVFRILKEEDTKNWDLLNGKTDYTYIQRLAYISVGFTSTPD